MTYIFLLDGVFSLLQFDVHTIEYRCGSRADVLEGYVFDVAVRAMRCHLHTIS